jgi:hypothetical protein
MPKTKRFASVPAFLAAGAILAMGAAGCAHVQRARVQRDSNPAAPSQTHEVTLVIDGKVAAKWTTTGNIEINGERFIGPPGTTAPNAMAPPALTEKAQ